MDLEKKETERANDREILMKVRVYYNFCSCRTERHTRGSIKRIKRRFTISETRSTEREREREINRWEKDENRVKGYSLERRKGIIFVQQKCSSSEMKICELSWRKSEFLPQPRYFHSDTCCCLNPSWDCVAEPVENRYKSTSCWHFNVLHGWWPSKQNSSLQQ